QDPNPLTLRVLCQHKLRHGSPGILHKRERRHTKPLAGGAIDLAHLGSADDFHDLEAAICSTWRSWAGSPMAMRKSPGSMRSSGAGLKRIPLSRLIART